MSLKDLTPTLALLRKVLGSELKAGCRNTTTTGAGIQAYFRQHFERYDYDEPSWAVAEGILAYLRRYEAGTTLEERERVAAIILKKLDATEARLREESTGPPAAVSDRNAPERRAPLPAGNGAGASPTAASPGESMKNFEPLSPIRGTTLQPIERAATAPPNGRAAEQLPPGDDSSAPDDVEEQPRAWQEHASVAQKQVKESVRAAKKPPVAQETTAASSLEAPAAEALNVRTQEQSRLEQLGITTLRSAVEYWPRDHYDFSAPVRINRMRPDMPVTLVGILRSIDIRRTPNKHVQVIEAKVSDPTGVMSVTWFNQPFLMRTLKPRVGEEIAISGKVESFGGRLQLSPRDVEFPADDEDGTNTRRIVPVYPSSEGIAQRWIRRLISRALSAGAGLVADPLPEAIRRDFTLLERRQAVTDYHFPASMDARDEARNRLALDELLLIQLGMLQRKRQWQGDEVGRGIPADAEALAAFKELLPFTLTGAQDRALGEILGDMAKPVPMSRLLQGDVGSGKTVVAAAALLACAKAGMQGAIMAPTEILAEQHERTLSALLAPHGITVALLTGSVPKARRARIYLEAVQGTIQVLVGTHALIQEDFKFGKLGLAIVDEQHRFGVVQRAALKGKGYNPHLLVMTATPIPRTLTLTLYGDLDVSVIDERPPHRQPVTTTWTPQERVAFDLVREQVHAGRQAFVICPLVEESENLEARAAVAEGKRLQTEIFPELRLEILHGKMKSQDKDAVLTRFRDGEINVLVATSVVEVGIDVPNATVMVVEDADRFGLAQLHQFRGRVGRGAEQSFCVLLSEPSNPNARDRLQALCNTEDGFMLAEEDLRLRGPGEFWGTRQSGLPALQVAQVTDMPTLALARRVADAILAEDPLLTEPRHAVLAENMRRFWDRAAEPS